MTMGQGLASLCLAVCLTGWVAGVVVDFLRGAMRSS
jgi:hypothetical protein